MVVPELAGTKSMHGFWTFATGTIHQTVIHVTESLIKAMYTAQLRVQTHGDERCFDNFYLMERNVSRFLRIRAKRESISR